MRGRRPAPAGTPLRARPSVFGSSRRSETWRQSTPIASPELARARSTFPSPERHHRRLPGRARDHHAMRLDLLDSPARVAQGECLTDAPLVDEFLVELAQPRPPCPEVNRILARVGNRAATHERELGRARQRRKPVVNPVPHHSAPAGRAAPGVGNRPEISRKTLSNDSAERSWNGYAERTRSNSAGTSQGSIATQAMTCCASTSRQL